LEECTWLEAATVVGGGLTLGMDVVVSLGENVLPAVLPARAEVLASGDEQDARTTTTTATPATSREGETIIVLGQRGRT
jgi:hypothetical protein